MIETNFKHTDIGLIPHDWEVKKLGENASIYRGGSPRPIEAYITNSPEGVNWLKIGDVSPTDKYFTHCAEKITPLGTACSRQVHKGDFILSNSMSFGRPYILKIDGCIHDGWLVIQDYTTSFNMEYLYYVLSSDTIKAQYVSMAAGSSVQNLNKDKVACVQIATPPTLDEQEKIASALSKIDQLINDLGALIEKKKAIKQGTMQDLLTAKRRLKGFTGEWNSVKLGDLLEYRQPTKYLVSSKEYTTQGVPVLTAGKTFILGYTQENWGLYDDLPVIIFDDFVVESKYVTMPFKVKSSAIKMLSLREKENDLRFIFEKMQCIEFPIADHKRHWISEYSQLEITIPEPNEQRAIANILSSMDTEITNLEQKRDKYIAIKQGMMQNLLTGKIRLI